MFSKLIKIFVYILPYKKRLFFGLFLLSVAAYLATAVPSFLGFAIDEISSDNIDFYLLFFYIFIIFIFIFIKAIIFFYARYILITTSRLVEHSMRQMLIYKLFSLSMSFYDRYKTGDIMSRVMQDLEYVRSIFGPGIMYTMNVIFLLIFSVINIFRIDFILALFIFLIFSLFILVLRFIGIRSYNCSRDLQFRLSELSSFVSEYIQGIRVIKAYVREEILKKKFAKLNIEYIKTHLEYAKLYGLIRPVLFFMLNLSAVFIIWIIGDRVVSGDLSVGVLVEFLVYIEILTNPSIVMGFIVTIFYRGVASYSRIEEILDYESDVNDDKALDFFRKNSDYIIEFRDLKFFYPGSDDLILDRVSFKVRHAEKVAIVGATGSGKSTLLYLLLRLYRARDESIFLDGVPIERIAISNFRNRFSAITQDSILFYDTIYKNISFSLNFTANQYSVFKSAEIACVDDQIRDFDSGYDTIVGEGGVTLSGGQKQRIAIARGILKNADIVVFDDSFSNLDSHTESKLLQNIYSNYPDMTIIISTHRVSTLRYMDKVVVMEDGKVENITTPSKFFSDTKRYNYLLQGDFIL